MNRQEEKIIELAEPGDEIIILDLKRTSLLRDLQSAAL